MIRICHLADIHLGYRKYSKITKSGVNQREVDVAIAFREAIDRIIALKPSAVVIAGDLFHSVRPSNAVVTSAFRELRRLAIGTKSPVIISAGNHESPKRADSGCILRLFSEIPGVYVADTKAERFSFKELELSFLALPHSSLTDLQAGSLRADDACRFNVLIAHGQVGERWLSDFGGVELSLQALSPHEWNYIALGHVHVPRQVALNCWYSGATEHTANNIWAEKNENKGFLEVLLEKDTAAPKVLFHSLSSPREVHTLDSINGSQKTPEELTVLIDEALSSISGGIEGKIVRLEIYDVTREIVRQVNHRALKQYRAAALHLLIDFKQPVQKAQTTMSSAGKVNLQSLLSSFCSAQIDDVPRREALQNLISDYFKKLEVDSETAAP